MFKKQALLLIICSVVTMIGSSVVVIAQDEIIDITNYKEVKTAEEKTDKIVAQQNLAIDEENQKIINSLIKSSVGYKFKNKSEDDEDSKTTKEEHELANLSEEDKYIKMANELMVIISEDRYDLLIWYINTYLSDNKTALKDKYSSYDEFKTIISDLFPENKFFTQLDMGFMKGMERDFYSLMLQSYEHQYLSSLTDKQKKILEKEKEAWIKYKSLALDTFDKLHVEDGGSIGYIWRSDYATNLNNQYYSTILSCSFDNDDLGATIKVDDKLISSAPKYFRDYLTYLDSYSKESIDKIITLLTAELKAWNEWIKIRESYGENGLDNKNCAYDYYTEKLKKQKLIDLRNVYENYATASSSYAKILLKDNSSMKDVINYNLKEVREEAF